jgi:hypothetical protein
MFEFLNGNEFIKNDTDFSIIGFDQNEGIFLVEDLDTKKIVKTELSEIETYHHFANTENWAGKLFNKLIDTNELHFSFWSLESNDSWDFKIVRTETVLTAYLTLVNYTITFIDERIVGKVYTTTLGNESVEAFEKWLEEQMEDEELFNYSSCYQNLDGILLEDSMVTLEEVDFIYDNLEF